MSPNQFSELFSEGIDESVELGTTEREIVERYHEKAEKLSNRQSAVDGRFQKAIRELKEAKSEEDQKIRGARELLRFDMQDELVDKGITEEKVAIMQKLAATADVAATKGLNAIGKAKRFVEERVNGRVHTQVQPKYNEKELRGLYS